MRFFPILFFSLFLIVIYPASGEYVTTGQSNYNNGTDIKIYFDIEHTITGGALYIYVYNNTTFASELIDAYSGSSKGYISGMGIIYAPFYGTNWNQYNTSHFGTYDIFRIQMYYENNTYCCDSFFNITEIPLTPTPSPTPAPVTLPNVTSNPNISNTTGEYNTTLQDDYESWSEGIVATYNNSISGIFEIIDYPFSGLKSGISSINSSLNNSTYNISMSFLLVTVPPVIDSIPNKIKALITLYLVFLVILIILGRE